MLRLLLGSRQPKLTNEQIKEPFLRRVRFEVERENYQAAVAFLTSALELLPEDLDLRFQRAQIQHLGLFDCCKALKDYRKILSALNHDQDHPLYRECKKALAQMMDFAPSQSQPMRA